VGRTGTRRAALVLLMLTAVLLVACVAGAAFGAVPIAPTDVTGAIGAAISGSDLTPAQALVMDLRLPRVALAALVGACLAAAGVLYQALFRNALADPYILGVSSGAGLGAALTFAAGGTGAAVLWAPPLAAFAGRWRPSCWWPHSPRAGGSWRRSRFCWPAWRCPTLWRR